MGASRDCFVDIQIKSILDEITSALPDPFSMQEIMSKVPPEDRTPYVIVAFQECERMNGLTSEIRRSLKELDLGLKVYIHIHCAPANTLSLTSAKCRYLPTATGCNAIAFVCPSVRPFPLFLNRVTFDLDLLHVRG